MNAATECDPTERQGSSIWKAACRTLVTVCEKFQLVRCSRLWATVERRCVLKCAVNHGSWTQCINMKFCFKMQKSAEERHEMLKLVYGDAAVTMKMVYKWSERFCNGCESVEDEERSGHPSTSKTQEIVERVSEMIWSNRQLTIRGNFWGSEHIFWFCSKHFNETKVLFKTF